MPGETNTTERSELSSFLYEWSHVELSEVFKGVMALLNLNPPRVVVTLSQNGWMKKELTKD